MYYFKQHIYYKQKDKQMFIAPISTNAESLWLFL